MDTPLSEVKAQVTLEQFISTGGMRHASHQHGGEWCGPCPFCGGRDRFYIRPNDGDGGSWGCRSCSPGYHDVITFLEKQNNCDFTAARAELYRLAGKEAPPMTSTVSTHRTRIEPEIRVGILQAPAYAWQQAMSAIALECHRLLMAMPSSTPIRRALIRRGLTDATLEAWSVGYAPGSSDRVYGTNWYDWLKAHLPAATVAELDLTLSRDKTGQPKLYIPCGVTLPHFHYETSATRWTGIACYGLKVRRLTPEPYTPENPKYTWVAGSKPGLLYGMHTLAERTVGVIVEGEFDAILLHQLVGATVGVATLGSAADHQLSTIRAHPNLCYWSHLTKLLIAIDNDTPDPKTGKAAGEEAAKRWQAATTRAVRWVPPAKDVSALYRTAGREAVCDWLKEGTS